MKAGGHGGPTPDYLTDENPPTFIWHTADDPVVPVRNAMAMANSLSVHKVTFEPHIYLKGRMGWPLQMSIHVTATRR